VCSLRCKGIACSADFEEKKCETCRFHIQLAATIEYGLLSSHCLICPINRCLANGRMHQKKNTTTQVVYYISRELRKIQRGNFRENSWA